jgi:FlaA1/EpsC-like NDP-sugar epimerase
MAAMLWLSGFITLNGKNPFHSMGDWAAHLPVWIAPVFGLLFISHAYIKVWRNSFFRDYLWLAVAILAGCILSLALLFIFKPAVEFLILNQMLVFCFLTSFGIVGIRVPHHFLREWGISSQNNNGVVCQRNILIYGAGAHGGLYLRERYLKYASELGGVCIIGFIDDDERLKNQYTFGLKVLGNVNDLESITKKMTIDEIVLSTAISEERFFILQKIANEMNIKLFEWKAYTTRVDNAV